MRVLLAAKFMPTGPRPIGGVQSWVGTVEAELRRRGVEVDLWQPGFSVPSGRFRLGILANWAHTAGLADTCDQLLVVSHGIIAEEQPPAGVPVVFTSEGVRDFWGSEGTVIGQPIDLAFWTPCAPRGNDLVRYSYRSGLAWLPSAAQALGMGFRHLRDVTHDEARAALSRAGCVLATGRAALEAMACGAPVVICDHRSAYQGPLLDPDTFGSRARNYSGRGGVAPDVRGLIEAVRQAKAGGSMRGHVQDYHDARVIVDQLLEAACSSC
jgi:hypothetical protein